MCAFFSTTRKARPTTNTPKTPALTPGDGRQDRAREASRRTERPSFLLALLRSLSVWAA